MKQMQSARPVVLVIDDNPAMRTVIRETLEVAGMTVFGTDVGPTASTLLILISSFWTSSCRT